jgi:hypothetical protein
MRLLGQSPPPILQGVACDSSYHYLVSAKSLCLNTHRKISTEKRANLEPHKNM